MSHQLYPMAGGQGAYSLPMHSQPIEPGTISWMLINFMSDGLVVSFVHSFCPNLLISRLISVVAIYRHVPRYSVVLPHRDRSMVDIRWVHM